MSESHSGSGLRLSPQTSQNKRSAACWVREAGEAAIHECRVIPTPKTLARFIGRQCSLTYPHDRDESWTQEVV